MVLENTLESPLDCKEIKPVNPKENQSWIFIRRTDAETEAPVLWSRDVKSRLIRKDWCWERLKPGREGDDRWWDGWMTSLTQWTRVWASSGRWWRTGKPGVLQVMGLQSQTGLSDWTTIATVAEVEAPMLWPPDAKSQLIGKDSDDGKDWRQKEKGPAEDETVR